MTTSNDARDDAGDGKPSSRSVTVRVKSIKRPLTKVMVKILAENRARSAPMKTPLNPLDAYPFPQESIEGDLAEKAKTALAKVELLTIEVEAIETKVRATRVAWADYGRALLEQRRLMPDKVAFGRWVEDNKLDLGLARSPSVRSNAMWLAAYWDVLKSCKTNIHHPTAFRAAFHELINSTPDADRDEKRINAELARRDFSPSASAQVKVVVSNIQKAHKLANQRMRGNGKLTSKDVAKLMTLLEPALEGTRQLDTLFKSGAAIFVDPTTKVVAERKQTMGSLGYVTTPDADEDLSLALQGPLPKSDISVRHTFFYDKLADAVIPHKGYDPDTNIQ